MSQFAIVSENLGKRYRIGAKQARYRTLRVALSDSFAAPFRRAAALFRGEAYGAAGLTREIWALRNVSFEIGHGEVVGLIGRNGAGKSTALKVLARITEPTEGEVRIRGRIGTLLEVGTGFHPELTGRENIFLSGAILGMRKAEIDAKFDEIVEFSEIETFLDTPVKHYSSGMYVRLAFAVAAHLEPEILFVDEVLSVGDMQFQRKCLGKMDDVAKQGRTVLFVSHNLSAVRNLCQRGFLLDEGRLIRDGAANEIVDYYLGRCLEDSSQGEVDLRGLPRERSSTVSSRIVALRTRDAQGATVSEFGLGEEFNLEIDVENVSAGGFMMAVFIENTEGVRVYHMRSQDVAFDSANKHPNAMVRISIPRLCIVEGQYLITVSLRTSSNALEDTVSRALSFRMRNRETTDRNWPAVIDEKGVWVAVKT